MWVRIPLLSLKNKQIKNILLKLGEVEWNVLCAYEFIANTSVKKKKYTYPKNGAVLLSIKKLKLKKMKQMKNILKKVLISKTENLIPIHMSYAEEQKKYQ